VAGLLEAAGNGGFFLFEVRKPIYGEQQMLFTFLKDQSGVTAIEHCNRREYCGKRLRQHIQWYFDIAELSKFPPLDEFHQRALDAVALKECEAI
jgi:hypothetical protein